MVTNDELVAINSRSRNFLIVLWMCGLAFGNIMLKIENIEGRGRQNAVLMKKIMQVFYTGGGKPGLMN